MMCLNVAARRSFEPEDRGTSWDRYKASFVKVSQQVVIRHLRRLGAETQTQTQLAGWDSEITCLKSLTSKTRDGEVRSKMF